MARLIRLHRRPCPSASCRARGRISGRLPPARMNAMILPTSGSSANSFATASIRSAMRPSTKNSDAIGPAQPMHLGFGRAAAPQADDIQSDQRAGLAERKSERDDVVAGRRHARHHDALADAHELMDGDVAAEEGVIADADMTAEHDVVGEGHVVADLAIVPDMGADHEQAARRRRASRRRPSSVPVFMVTLSRNSQRAPMTSRVAPPR